MIRDRGNIKWTAMMLSEHIKELRVWKEEDNQIEHPLFDEWELESIQMEVELAFKRQSEAIVTVWRKGKEVAYIGKISELDHRLNLLSIEGPFGEDRVPIVDVIKVQSMN